MSHRHNKKPVHPPYNNASGATGSSAGSVLHPQTGGMYQQQQQPTYQGVMPGGGGGAYQSQPQQQHQQFLYTSVQSAPPPPSSPYYQQRQYQHQDVTIGDGMSNNSSSSYQQHQQQQQHSSGSQYLSSGSGSSYYQQPVGAATPTAVNSQQYTSVSPLPNVGLYQVPHYTPPPTPLPLPSPSPPQHQQHQAPRAHTGAATSTKVVAASPAPQYVTTPAPNIRYTPSAVVEDTVKASHSVVSSLSSTKKQGGFRALPSKASDAKRRQYHHYDESSRSRSQSSKSTRSSRSRSLSSSSSIHISSRSSSRPALSGPLPVLLQQRGRSSSRSRSSSPSSLSRSLSRSRSPPVLSGPLLVLPVLPPLPTRLRANPNDPTTYLSHEQRMSKTVDAMYGSVPRVFVPSKALPLEVTSLIDLVAMHVVVGGPLVSAEIQAREKHNPLFSFMKTVQLFPTRGKKGNDQATTKEAKEVEGDAAAADRGDAEGNEEEEDGDNNNRIEEEAAVSKEDNNEWSKAVATALSNPEVIYYRWRLYSLLNGDTLASWKDGPFTMELLRWKHSEGRGGGKGIGRLVVMNNLPAAAAKKGSPNGNLKPLVWVPPPPIAFAGAASVYSEATTTVPSSCLYTTPERTQIEEGGISVHCVGHTRLFNLGEEVRHGQFTEYYCGAALSPSEWVYPREEPWAEEYTSSTGWMSRQASQQQVPHVSVSSFSSTCGSPASGGGGGRSSSGIEDHLHHRQQQRNPLLGPDVCDDTEVDILGGTRDRASGEMGQAEELRCIARLPALLSQQDALQWKALLDAKSLVKRMCLASSTTTDADAQQQRTVPKVYEWFHVVQPFLFLLDGYDSCGSSIPLPPLSSSSPDTTSGGKPPPYQLLDDSDLKFISTVLQPALLDKDAVIAPRTLFALQHHRAPLHVIGLILDEMISLAHLPTQDVFVAIDAGIREIHQQRGQQQAPPPPQSSDVKLARGEENTDDGDETAACCSFLTVSDLSRIKRRIVLVHQFGMLFCLFLLHDITSAVQIYGGSAVLSYLWKNRLKDENSSSVIDDGSQSSGSGGDGEGGGVHSPDSTACLGMPTTFAIPCSSENVPVATPQQQHHAHQRGQKRSRVDDDVPSPTVSVVPVLHFAGLIRSIELVSAAVVESVLMLAGYEHFHHAGANKANVFAKLTSQPVVGEGTAPNLHLYSGVLLRWLSSIVGEGWFGDGVVVLPTTPSSNRGASVGDTSTKKGAGGVVVVEGAEGLVEDTIPPPLSLHPLVGLTERFALQHRIPLSIVRHLSFALLNHPAVLVLLPAQRRRVTLLDKYPFIFQTTTPKVAGKQGNLIN